MLFCPYNLFLGLFSTAHHTYHTELYFLVRSYVQVRTYHTILYRIVLVLYYNYGDSLGSILLGKKCA